MRFENTLQCVKCGKDLKKIKERYSCGRHKFLGDIPDFILNKKELENGLSGSSQIWNSWVSVII